MPRVIVLPTPKDQALLICGDAPESHFDRSFETDGERLAYIRGIDKAEFGVEYKVSFEDQCYMELHRSAGVHTFCFAFHDAAEKEAFKQGLADGRDCSSPEVIGEHDDRFDSLAILVSAAPLQPR